MASVTTPTASAATLAASADLDDNDLRSSSEASSSDDVEEEDDYDEEEDENDEYISLLTTKMQHSSEPLEDLLSLGRVDQEYVLQEIIRKANVYDDMVRLAEEDASSMKHFFTPSQRLRDKFDMYDDEDHGYTEVELAVSIEEFLNYRSDWSDFRPLSTGYEDEMGKLIWIIEDTFFWIKEDNTEVDFDWLEQYVVQRATFTASSGETHVLVLAKFRTSTSLSAIAFSVFWHVVTTSNCVKLKFETDHFDSDLVFETISSQLLKTSPSLELLEFEGSVSRNPAVVLLQLWRGRVLRSPFGIAILTPMAPRTLSSSGFDAMLS
jgi:hypothetical protein